jgi:hypothetical protein
MRRLCLFITMGVFLALIAPAQGATGKVIKVLPQFLDLKGRHALSPSLFERDAYQAYLLAHPAEVSGLRFAIQWNATGPAYGTLKLKVELRGTAKGDLPSQTVLEQTVKPGGWFSHWASLPLVGDKYAAFGKVTAWRVTLWEGDRLLSEQRSFLW